ncbi:TonB-dependent receptor [Leptospira stimsonii]|uniref:TonB-denpendent receptor n=1 Tax=Leptospira stimsonii TaxID=2202203 RepID=A0ABY2N1H3_9LEPT|nr:TonB-dependent receptor [Leptospira stimsonii]TGK20519.1 TonB-denpendent receptor [Leptospira stimsonii]TGM14309.1 TonB-denpendent receptor [Leptospira stimsonii]
MLKQVFKRIKLLLIFFLCIGIQTRTNAQEPSIETEGNKNSGIVVNGKSDFGLGVAGSASEGTIRSEQIRSRPISRTGEIAEFIPGMIVTQHSGPGKANQYYLRGFNLDHGTDFATNVNGIPVNNPSHGHGQGYSDISFIIPELIDEIRFKKGVYYAEEGNFSSAGAMNLSYFRTLKKGIVSVEGGTFGYGRTLIAKSHQIGPGNLLYAIEASHSDGPWTVKEDYKKINGVLSYTFGDEQNGFRFLGMGYRGTWHTTHQIPKRALEKGKSWLFPENDGIGRYDTIDPNDGGKTSRGSLSWEGFRRNKNTDAKLLIFGLYNDLALFSNTTYFLNDPERGDQIEQTDRRSVSGLKGSYKILSHWNELKFENQFGLQIRRDFIDNSLYHTEARAQLEELKRNRIIETNLSVYYENRIQWNPKIRTFLGIRGDQFQFHVDDKNPELSDRRRASVGNPKAGIVFGPWSKTEIYFNAGHGFHTNDARGITDKTHPFIPIVISRGAETGIRSNFLDIWRTTFSLWQLDLDSELIFEGDAARTEPSRSSSRRGVEWSNSIEILKNLTFDADVSISRSRFQSSKEEPGNFIPGSIENVYTGGITLKEANQFFGSVRGRYFGPRSLIEDNSVRSQPTTLFSFQAGKKFDENWSLVFEIFNLQNAKVSDIDYYYASRLKHEAEGPDEGGYNDIHTRPSPPRSVRLSLRGTF